MDENDTQITANRMFNIRPIRRVAFTTNHLSEKLYTNFMCNRI